jgi:hypothetical protein
LNAGGASAAGAATGAALSATASFSASHGEARSQQDQRDADDAQRRERLAQQPDRNRQGEDEIDLLHRRREVGADRSHGAVVAVAPPDEMQDAGGRKRQHRLEREAADRVERSGGGGRDEEQRHADRHRDRHALQHRSGQHAAPDAGIVQGKRGGRQKSEKTSEHPGIPCCW